MWHIVASGLDCVLVSVDVDIHPQIKLIFLLTVFLQFAHVFMALEYHIKSTSFYLLPTQEGPISTGESLLMSHYSNIFVRLLYSKCIYFCFLSEIHLLFFNFFNLSFFSFYWFLVACLFGGYCMCM